MTLLFLYIIGELGKLEMLHEGILHKCIKQLLEKKKNIPLGDMSEDLECLCHLMRTIGRRLDTSKAKVRPERLGPPGAYLLAVSHLSITVKRAVTDFSMMFMLCSPGWINILLE